MKLSKNTFSEFTSEAGSLRFVERSEWFARLPVNELEPLEQPAIRVIIAYTAGQFATTRVCNPRIFQSKKLKIQLD